MTKQESPGFSRGEEVNAPTTMIGRPAGGSAQPTHTEAPDLAAALDAIDLQLAAGGDGVVLPRDAAAMVACALHDLLDLLARAWDEGFDAGERDAMDAAHTSGDSPCIPNPYRQEANHG